MQREVHEGIGGCWKRAPPPRTRGGFQKRVGTDQPAPLGGEVGPGANVMAAIDRPRLSGPRCSALFSPRYFHPFPSRSFRPRPVSVRIRIAAHRALIPRWSLSRSNRKLRSRARQQVTYRYYPPPLFRGLYPRRSCEKLPPPLFNPRIFPRKTSQNLYTSWSYFPVCYCSVVMTSIYAHYWLLSPPAATLLLLTRLERENI